jgi:16S rRNA (guanine527-N7)-methyltransferase
VTPAQERLLRRYCDLLAAAPVSVTAVRDPAAAWERHVLDALAALPLVRALAPARPIDVGSGGGAPGIPLAVALGVPVTLLEATGTKARFLRDVVAELGLACPVAHARSEELARRAGRDAYDLALARALAPPPVALELSLPLVAPGGHLVLWAGTVERAALDGVAAQLAARVERIAPAGGTRTLALVAKMGATPTRFPRRPGMARKRPLRAVPSPQ